MGSIDELLRWLTALALFRMIYGLPSNHSEFYCGRQDEASLFVPEQNPGYFYFIEEQSDLLKGLKSPEGLVFS